MTIEPPAPGEPRRPHGPRDPGDAWVVAPTGEKYWGLFGAAGLLAVDSERGVLLQHRVSWSHFGDTWALPGGARHEGESARDGALRESAEEAGVPVDAVQPHFESVLDLGIWSYTTLVADVTIPFEPVISDPESVALAWVPVDEVEDLPLHPGFAVAWPSLRQALSTRPAIVVDVANVMGSVPDGWWNDRAGAAERLLTRLSALAHGGVDAEQLDLPATRWFPFIGAVLEGEARDADVHHDLVAVWRASGSGDDEIVRVTEKHVGSFSPVVVVTSDRGLAARVEALGARVRGARWLRDQLG
ncbi:MULTISPECIES: NUDIX domain-containing protein [Microbacterium]|uniref:NUDIX domain-containing protein n=1 Tax=Microbacterium TaxID=33882 RepID=UPI00278AA498|nr:MULTISPECIES: NUDIX hydrolase [Microbacterium]MDQ1083566.1 8-oxo-dGTP diphosphatase [Microbacterium sp. SORGH_AS_0344]MDQ1171157.1 8-oxo-dGTP diphosphatase [Microbacterium proteolyticum]